MSPQPAATHAAPATGDTLTNVQEAISTGYMLWQHAITDAITGAQWAYARIAAERFGKN